ERVAVDEQHRRGVLRVVGVRAAVVVGDGDAAQGCGGHGGVSSCAGAGYGGDARRRRLLGAVVWIALGVMRARSESRPPGGRMEAYRAMADGIAADIAAGRIRPGRRLPPQRGFARERGIAPSTAARVYRELARRGLVTGEVGRGTYVRAGRPPADPPLAEPGGALVDLELNYLPPGEWGGRVAAAVGRVLRRGALEAALRPAGAAGGPALRAAAAGVAARGGWAPDPEGALFAGNGRQAIAAALSALVPTGGRVAVENL